MANISITQSDIDTWVSQIINCKSNDGKNEQHIEDVRQNLEKCLIKKKAVVRLESLNIWGKKLGKIQPNTASIKQCKNYNIKKARSGQPLSTDNNHDEIISNMGKHQRTISQKTVARSSTDKHLLNTYNIKTGNEEPNKRLISKDVPSTSMNHIDPKNKDNVFETVENAVNGFSINLSLNFETSKKRKFIITCEACEGTQCNSAISEQKYKKAKSMHLENAQNDTKSFEISCLLDEILNDDNDSERLSKRSNISNNGDQSTNGLQKQFDITDGKKNHKRNSKAKVPKPLKKQVIPKRNRYKKSINNNNDNIASPAKGDLARYVEHFAKNCEVGNSVTPVTTLNASPQLVISNTENFEQPVTSYSDSNFNLVPSNEIVGNLIASSNNSVTYVNGFYNTNSSDDAIQHSTSTQLRNVNIPLYTQNTCQLGLETVYVEPSMNLQFSLMSSEEARSLSQSMFPKSHSFYRRTPQLSWSTQGLMLEKPLSEDAYKPLNLSKKGRNNSITQQGRSEETFDADDIIREVIKIGKIDVQQSLTDENDDNPVSNSIEAPLSMPLLDFDERHFDNLLDDVTSDVINPLEGKDKLLDAKGNTGLCSGETTTVTNTHIYSTQCENNKDLAPLSVFPQSLSDFGTGVGMLKFVHLTQSEKDILSRKANSCNEINVSLSDAEKNGTIMPSASESPLYHSIHSLISTRHVEEEVKELNNNGSQGAKEFQSHVIDSAKSIRNDSNDLNIQKKISGVGDSNHQSVESRSKDENILFSDFNQESSETSLRSPDDSFKHIDSQSEVVLKEAQQLPIVLDCPLLEKKFRIETLTTSIASPKNAKFKNGGEDIIREVQTQREKEKDSAKIVKAAKLILKQSTDIDNTASIKVEMSDLPKDIQLEGNEKNVVGAGKNVIGVKLPIPEIEKEDIILNDELDDVLSLAPSSTFGSPTMDHFVIESVIENGDNEELRIEPYTPTPSMKAKKYIIPKLSNNRNKPNIDKEQLGNRQGCASISFLYNNRTVPPTTESVSAQKQQQQLQKPTIQKLLNYIPMHWTNAVMNNLEDIFGVTCLLYLKGKCTTNLRCTLSHQFNNTDIVVQVLQNLPSISLNSLYNYMYANSCLFHIYFKYFCQFYAYGENRVKLLNIVYDCERYPEYSSELSNVYKAFINCGISKMNACHLILERLKYTNSISIISELVVIIVDADWTMFTDYLKQITRDCVKYYFPINLLEQMAIDVIKNPHTSLKRILGECMQKVQKDEVPLLLNSENLMKCVKLLATKA